MSVHSAVECDKPGRLSAFSQEVRGDTQQHSDNLRCAFGTAAVEKIPAPSERAEVAATQVPDMSWSWRKRRSGDSAWHESLLHRSPKPHEPTRSAHWYQL